MTTHWAPRPHAFDLPANTVHVWRVRIDDPAVDPKHLKPLLNEDEAERAERFRFEHDRNRYVIGRGVLRELLSNYVAIDAAAIQFTYTTHGKPVLAPHLAAAGVHFNVSHSGARILLGFAKGHTVGVDVESIERKTAREKIAERYFSPDETAHLRALPAERQPVAFFECWTRKEAFIKAHGDGLSLPLDSFSVAFAAGGAPRLLRFDRAPGPECWSLDAPDIGGEYVAAACVAVDRAAFAHFDYAPADRAH